jgi:hypothetical protein
LRPDAIVSCLMKALVNQVLLGTQRSKTTRSE